MTELDIDDILRILPHRYPFLLVDRIIETDGHTRIVGIKNVSMNEGFFQGHFPNFPVMPGVLQLEALAQVAGILLNIKSGREGKIALFSSVDKAKFRKMVRPGDTLRMEVTFIKARLMMAKVEGVCYVGDEIASQAELAFTFLPDDDDEKS
jgi:beta-hydroxyacyl-ACP dehydratase FabZ